MIKAAMAGQVQTAALVPEYHHCDDRGKGMMCRFCKNSLVVLNIRRFRLSGKVFIYTLYLTVLSCYTFSQHSTVTQGF